MGRSVNNNLLETFALYHMRIKGKAKVLAP